MKLFLGQDPVRFKWLLIAIFYKYTILNILVVKFPRKTKRIQQKKKNILKYWEFYMTFLNQLCSRNFQE